MHDLENIPDPDPIKVVLKCLRAEQPVGDIFLSAVPYETIIRITYFDVRRVIQEERDVERYLGIQRPLERRRVEKLREYVNFYDASFPTAIIIAVNEEYAEYDERNGELILSNVKRGDNHPDIPIRNLARVIDGQHRIAGLGAFVGSKFDVPVTIFVGADIADQAHVFATVNLEQTKVHKSLAYDLYSLAKTRSPQKTCHNIAVILDKDEDSPFHKRIKRLGVPTVGRDYEPISQATFVEALIRYISKDPKRDRDLLLRGKHLESVKKEEILELPFRNLFVDENDVHIAEIIYNYFSEICERWPDAWASRDKGMMLNRTNGFRAFMKYYKDLHLQHGDSSGGVPRKKIRQTLLEIPLRDRDFTTENFPPGSSGESKLYRVISGTEEPTFI